jgi:arylsulfatase A-like enzyme
MDEIAAAYHALYAREVSYVDEQFGRLVAGLRELGRWENTLVVVVSDHGEGLGDHGWGYHRILYQEQIHAPYLMRLPGVAGGTSGKVVDPLVRTVDVAPTLLDVLGLPPLAGASGRSLRALVEGSEDPARIAFADQINGYDLNTGPVLLKNRPQDTWVYGAMDRRWKLLYRPAMVAASELFDLANDPGETVNLFSFEHPEAQRLLRELARARPWVLEPCSQGGGSNEAQGALAHLGYGGNDPVEAEWRYTSITDRAWFSDTWAKDPAGEAPILIHR